MHCSFSTSVVQARGEPVDLGVQSCRWPFIICQLTLVVVLLFTAIRMVFVWLGTKRLVDGHPDHPEQLSRLSAFVTAAMSVHQVKQYVEDASVQQRAKLSLRRRSTLRVFKMHTHHLNISFLNVSHPSHKPLVV